MLSKIHMPGIAAIGVVLFSVAGMVITLDWSLILAAWCAIVGVALIVLAVLGELAKKLTS